MGELISVRQLIKEKSPERAARIPSIVYSLLERVAHQRILNRYILQADGLDPPEALDYAMQFLGISYTIVDACGTPLPDTGRITMTANHPHGGADALILLDLLTRRFGNAVVPANDLVQKILPLASFFAPINKHGSNREHYRRIDAIFASNTPLLMFPAGRTGRPKRTGFGASPVVDFPWTGSFIKKSRLHGRVIVPVHIRGHNSRLFYTIARLRSVLRIRTNLEMFLLVDELMKQRGKSFEAVIGPPIDPSRLDGRQTTLEWAAAVRAYVLALGEGVRDEFFSWFESYRQHLSVAARGLNELG